MPDLDQLWTFLQDKIFKDSEKVSVWPSRSPSDNFNLISGHSAVTAAVRFGEKGIFCADRFAQTNVGYCVTVGVWRGAYGPSAQNAFDTLPRILQEDADKRGQKPIAFLPERTTNHGEKVASYDPTENLTDPTIKWKGLRSWTIIGTYFVMVEFDVPRNDPEKNKWLTSTAPMVMDAAIEFLESRP
ncbi:MAG: hypothetical protein EXR96_04570 [Nitrospiraceae bacterium]|nr:hypothetical protein [Nitrospiraceae bacterium]